MELAIDRLCGTSIVSIQKRKSVQYQFLISGFDFQHQRAVRLL